MGCGLLLDLTPTDGLPDRGVPDTAGVMSPFVFDYVRIPLLIGRALYVVLLCISCACTHFQ